MKKSKSIVFKGLNLDVEYNYSPSEKPIFNHKEGTGSPECHEEYELLSVIHCGVDIISLFEENDNELEFIKVLMNG